MRQVNRLQAKFPSDEPANNGESRASGSPRLIVGQENLEGDPRFALTR